MCGVRVHTEGMRYCTYCHIQSVTSWWLLLPVACATDGPSALRWLCVFAAVTSAWAWRDGANPVRLAVDKRFARLLFAGLLAHGVLASSDTTSSLAVRTLQFAAVTCSLYGMSCFSTLLQWPMQAQCFFHLLFRYVGFAWVCSVLAPSLLLRPHWNALTILYVLSCTYLAVV